MEKGKLKITRRFVFTITSLAVLIFVVIFTIITFVIKQQNTESHVSDASATNSSETDNGITEDDFVSIESIPDEFDIPSYDTSEFINISDVTDVSDDVVDLIEHGWVINEYGYTYVYDGCGYEQFNYKSSALQRYVNSLNNFTALVPNSTRIFSITVPVSSTFANIPRDIYVEDNFYNQAQSTFVSTVSTLTNESITHIPIVDLLESSYDNGNYVFYRTDRNWTSDGAYLAYTEFCKNANFEVLPISNFTKNTVSGFLGSFYNATKSEAMKSSPDEFFYYLPPHSVKSSLTVYDSGLVYNNYSVCNNKIDRFNPQNVFLGRDAERFEIHTTETGGSLLIVGDESVYPMIPFLLPHYNRIDVINPNKYKTSFEVFLENRSYDDCLLMCYSTNSISGDYIPIFNSLTGVITNE